jgi:hypothetical protein
MAQRVVITLKDDIDGSDAAETVQFALDGKAYEIDLSETNAVLMRERLTPFINAARRGGRDRRGAGTEPKPKPDRPDPRVVRAWARDQGMDVPTRGRIPRAVYEQFHAKH